MRSLESSKVLRPLGSQMVLFPQWPNFLSSPKAFFLLLPPPPRAEDQALMVLGNHLKSASESSLLHPGCIPENPTLRSPSASPPWTNLSICFYSSLFSSLSPKGRAGNLALHCNYQYFLLRNWIVRWIGVQESSKFADEETQTRERKELARVLEIIITRLDPAPQRSGFWPWT